MDADRQQLERLLQTQLYHHPRVDEARTGAEHIIRDLFDAYLSNPRLLPDATRRRMAEDLPTRVVCDYVAGMTDRFALTEYGRVFGREQASIWPDRMVVNR
jgi:dGTPase